MSHIVIGKSGKHNVSIDSKILMTTRLLITSDSGGGKTWLLKRLIEQAFGNVGIIVIDPEGEFAPLRTKFDFFLVGKGGDVPADIRTAEKVAHTLLKGRASAICDIYEMHASERHIWVQRFLDALLDAPKELRHPYFVIVDEAHMFAPEHGKGESVAADAMKGLATRGRKRMLCGIFATQRLATLAKDLTGMCLNRLIGPTFESINQQRAALELGIQKGKEQTDFLAKVKMLDPGNFYALGRAITKDLELVHIGPIETPHGQDALKYELKPPPPTEKVREWLAKLGDLPKQAEEEAKTTADFKKQIRDLKAQLRATPTATKEVVVADPKAIERAVNQERSRFKREFDSLQTSYNFLSKGLAKIAKEALHLANIEIPKIELPKFQGGEIRRKDPEERLVQVRSSVAPPHPRPEVTAESNGDLSGPERKILRALSELSAIGKDAPPKAMCAAWAGYSPQGGAFGNPIGKLRTAALVRYPTPGTVTLTDAGREAAGIADVPDTAEVRHRIESICTGPERKILTALLDHGPDEMSKEDLAAASGYSPVGGAFGNPIGALRTKGLLDYPAPGMVKASDWLFTEI